MDRITQLEQDLELVKRRVRLQQRFLFGSLSVLILVVLAGAAAETQLQGDVSVSGVLKCLGLKVDGPVEVAKRVVLKEGLSVEGDVEADQNLAVRGKVTISGVDLLERIGQKSDKIVHASFDVGVSTVSETGYVTAFNGRDIPTDKHPFVNVGPPFPGPILATWAEPKDGLGSYLSQSFYAMEVHSSDRQVQLRATGNPSVKSHFVMKIHVLHYEK